MPFLRRRGSNMGSESDMRRRTSLDSLALPKQGPPKAGSTTDLPALTAVEEDPAPSVPAPLSTPPDDRPSTSYSHAASTVVDPTDRPALLPTAEEASRYRRFSMLRFRNASDSQLAAKAKQQAAAEQRPPLPRGAFLCDFALYA
jgi:hypothetical protein